MTIIIWSRRFDIRFQTDKEGDRKTEKSTGSPLGVTSSLTHFLSLSHLLFNPSLNLLSFKLIHIPCLTNVVYNFSDDSYFSKWPFCYLYNLLPVNATDRFYGQFIPVSYPMSHVIHKSYGYSRCIFYQPHFIGCDSHLLDLFQE